MYLEQATVVERAEGKPLCFGQSGIGRSGMKLKGHQRQMRPCGTLRRPLPANNDEKDEVEGIVRFAARDKSQGCSG